MEAELNFAGQDKGYLTELSSIHQVANIILPLFAKLMLLQNKIDSKREMEQLAKNMAERGGEETECSEETEYDKETEEESHNGMHLQIQGNIATT